MFVRAVPLRAASTSAVPFVLALCPAAAVRRSFLFFSIVRSSLAGRHRFCVRRRRPCKQSSLCSSFFFYYFLPKRALHRRSRSSSRLMINSPSSHALNRRILGRSHPSPSRHHPMRPSCTTLHLCRTGCLSTPRPGPSRERQRLMTKARPM